VKIQFVESSTATKAVVAGNEIPIATSSTAAALGAVAQGAGLKALSTANNASATIMMSSPDVKTVADLRNKVIGVSSTYSASDLVTRVVLSRNGLKYGTDVKVVSTGNSLANQAAFEQGQTQAIVVSGDQAVTLRNKGFFTLVNLAEQRLPMVELYLVANADWLRTNRAVAKGMVKALFLATKAIVSDYDLYVRTTKKYTEGISDEALKGSWDVFKLVWSDPINPRIAVEGVQSVVDILSEQDPKMKSLQLGNFIDNSIVTELKAEGLFAAGGCQGC
jgi:ABC-type nitrate/sulfonate/bicarbonate transport system substrate-binding protein